MVRLSARGQAVVDGVLAKREALQTFLREVLGLAAEQAEVDTCKIEHLISPRMAERLVRFMKCFGADDARARELLEQFRNGEGDCPASGNCTVCQGKCLLSRLTVAA